MNKFFLITAACLLFTGCKDQAKADPQTMNAQKAPEMDADWQITLKVKKAIMTDSSLSTRAKFVGISTSNGHVTLSGSVKSRADSKQAEDVAQRVPGVRSVDNQIVVTD